MIDDPNIEYEQSPEYDEDGNRIWYMTELDDVDEFTSYNFDTPPETIPDGYYDTVWNNGASVVTLADTENNKEELTNSVDVILENTNTNYSDEQGQLNAAEKNYYSAADKIVEILTNVLQKGEITGEDNADLLDAQRELSIYDTLIKNICNKQQTESYQLELQRMKENAAPTTIDGILNILTDGGTKPWLYKDDNNNVLVDMQSIPELTMLVNKLNLIATGDGESSAIKLAPEFIELISSSDLKFTAKNISLEGLVTANENFKILEDGSMMAKNGYFTGQIFVGDGSVIGDSALSDTIRDGANNGTLAIERVEITDANIKNLTSDIANINTLINGNLTSDNIQSMVITGDKFTVENGFIKNAMIDNVSASKINTGIINTNNVSIQSEDGSMLINGTTQQFKDENGKVRIQIGKDATGNFTFALFSQDGVGVLIDENGIKSGAVPNGLIVNDMVADGANISGSKLDINSVITNINNGTEVIKGTRIQLDEQGQSLEVAFNQLKTKVETIENVTIDGDLSSVIEQVTTNTTSIGIMQGQISSLISNTTITKENGEVVQLKDEYNSTKDTVNSHTTKIGALETNYDKVTGDIASVVSKQSVLEQNLDGFKTTVSNTYATNDSVSNLADNLNDNYYTITQTNSLIDQRADAIISQVSSTYTTTETTGTLLKESVTEYYLSTSNSTLSGGTWGTTAYTPTPGKYIWQRTKSTTYAGDVKYSTPICISDESYSVMLSSDVLLLKCNSDGEVI